MAAFTFNDACMKAVSSEVPFFQALFMRGVLTTSLLWFMAYLTGAFRTFSINGKDAKFIALRTLGEVGGTYFFISALYHMPLANVTAVLQALPLTVTLAGAVFLGDRIGWRRMVAILIGFIGVLLIIRPGPDGFDQYSLYACAAVLCVTFRDLAVRRIGRQVPAILVACIAATAVTLFAATGAVTTEWVSVAPRTLGVLALAAVFIMGGYLFSVLTMREGDIAFVAPFRYTGMLWALLVGYAVFGDWPANLTLLGAAIVVGMGLFSFWRERQLEKRQVNRL